MFKSVVNASVHRLPFSATGMVEAVPALLTSFVRTVKQFDNNKQIVALAEMVERRYTRLLLHLN